MTTDIQTTDLGGFSGDMSIFGLFWQAGAVVKLVMLALVLCSVWSWAIIAQKRSIIARLKKSASRFEDSFWSGEPLDKLYERVKSARHDPFSRTFVAGMSEWNAGVGGGLPARASLRAGINQRIERSMDVTIGRELSELERGMTFLASVGSVSPFVGLFGTVWGIIGSFSAIASTNNTSLAVVAPGIAEALLATAMGLVAAIPAVIAYNTFSSELSRYSDRLDGFVQEFSAILSRHMDSIRSNAAAKTSGKIQQDEKAKDTK